LAAETSSTALWILSKEGAAKENTTKNVPTLVMEFDHLGLSITDENVVLSVDNNVINAAYGKKVGELKAAVEVARGAGSLKIYSDAEKTDEVLDDNTLLNTEMIAEATAENGVDTRDYGINIQMMVEPVFTFKDAEGEDATGMTDGGEFAVVAYAGNPQPAILMAVLFNSDGQIEEVAIDKADYSSVNFSEMNVTIDLPDTLDGHYIKVFMWESFESMKPLIGKNEIR